MIAREKGQESVMGSRGAAEDRIYRANTSAAALTMDATNAADPGPKNREFALLIPVR
jgi:hypothetical protein